MSKEIQTIQPLQEISDIRRIMERSSRFISLSGLSGIAAGVCALIGAYIAYGILINYYHDYNTRAANDSLKIGFDGTSFESLKVKLLIVAVVVLVAALTLSFVFTWRRARQNHLPIWDMTARKLMWNVLIPLITGGFFIVALYQKSQWAFIAPACLVFYGLALVNGSKYTLSDIRYLGYSEIVLGLINTQIAHYGLYFWAVGFGVLHILYGVIMWFKYERGAVNSR